MRGRRSGGKGRSEQKAARDRAKAEKRARKAAKRVGKPAGERVELTDVQRALARAKAQAKTQIVRLRQIGEGWIPKISQEAYSRLKRHENVEVWSYLYEVDAARSEGPHVYFRVIKGLAATLGRETYVGTFLIDLEDLTIERVRGTKVK